MAKTIGANSLTEYGVPISVFKERVEQHLHHTITNKQFALLYSGWVTRYCITTNHNVNYTTAYFWQRRGYVPKEHANHLMNYLITGEKVV